MDFQHIWLPAADGADQALTLLLLHGTGGDENDLIPIGKMFGKHINLLSVRGKVAENGMNRFFRRFAEGIFDVADLKFRADELNTFLSEAAEKYTFNPEKIIALGYSNGANIAGGLLLQHPETLAGAILLRAMIPFEAEKNWQLNGTKILTIAGKNDPLTTSQESEKWAETLKNAGGKVTPKTLNTGHNLTQEDIQIALEWFNIELSE
ncbi:MAG: alpha/beta hydrolase [Verrucomicrobia bacterium]|nr:alpha/beta hydrolase [Cytophagales bacterium]